MVRTVEFLRKCVPQEHIKSCHSKITRVEDYIASHPIQDNRYVFKYLIVTEWHLALNNLVLL